MGKRSSRASGIQPEAASSPTLSIALTGAQTIAHIEETYATLVKALTESADVVLDCSGVEDADVAFVQVLLAARRDAAVAGRRFALAAPAKDALARTLTAAGFAKPGHPEAWIDSFWAADR